MQEQIVNNGLKIAIFQRPKEKDQEVEGKIGKITDGIGEQISSFLGDKNLQNILPFTREDGQLDYLEVGGKNEAEFAGEKIFDHFSKGDISTLRQKIRSMDGLVLPGGLYSDKYEILLARLAVEEEIPILAICGGQNNLVRAFGGATGGSIKTDGVSHYQPDKYHSHSCTATNTDSAFYKLTNGQAFDCNSYHGSSPKDLGTEIKTKSGKCSLVSTGVDDDDNMEVLESITKNKSGEQVFDGKILATRFHPEINDGNMQDPTNIIYNTIKESFLARCQERKIENLREAAELGDTQAAIDLKEIIGAKVVEATQVAQQDNFQQGRI